LNPLKDNEEGVGLKVFWIVGKSVERVRISLAQISSKSALLLISSLEFDNLDFDLVLIKDLSGE
jgi:hypothetical protein